MLSYLGWKSSPSRTSDTRRTSSAPIAQSCPEDEDEPVLSVDVAELRNLFPPLPSFAWQHVTAAYTRTVLPICSTVYSTIHRDIDQLTQLFVDLDIASLTQTSSESYIEDADADDSGSHAASDRMPACATPELPQRKRQRSHSSEPIFESEWIIPSTDPSIPTIVVTPCPPQSPDSSCWVPYQDASFGNLLTVPTHPAVNDIFPPLLAKHSPFVEKWAFTGGHWKAILPSLEEQMQKGMFSRPMFLRRRRSCAHSCSRSLRSMKPKSI